MLSVRKRHTTVKVATLVRRSFQAASGPRGVCDIFFFFLQALVRDEGVIHVLVRHGHEAVGV